VAKRAGYVSAIDAQQLGFAIIEMGGGRKRLADLLDHRTGLTQIARLGDFVHQGDELVRFFNKSSHENERLEVQKKIEDAIVILDSPPKPFSLIHSIIE
jgi:thymidine phosphorylase